MKSDTGIWFKGRRERHRVSWASAVAVLSCAGAHGQQILVPPVEFPERRPSVEQASTNWVGSVVGPPLMRRPDDETRPLEVGPVRFHPHLGYQVSYGDGILRGPNDPQTTVLHTVLPGLALDIGRNWEVDFTAMINRYSNSPENDSTGYVLGISGRIPADKWLFNVSYGGSIIDEPRTDTGTQTQTTSHNLGVSAAYSFNTRVSMELGLAEDISLPEDFSESWATSTRNWLNYRVTEKTHLGFGLGGGYNAVDPGADSYFEQIQGRIVWLPGSKLSVQLSAGVQFQQFVTEITNQVEEIETDVFPIFEGSVVYQIFEPTALSLAASHLIANSSLEGQFTETTSVGAGLRQRLFKGLYLDVRPGYSFQQFRETSGELAVAREDRYFTFYAGLNAVLFKKLNAALFYQFNDNSSSEDEFAFDSTQVGLQINYRY